MRNAYADWHAIIVDAMPDVASFILERYGEVVGCGAAEAQQHDALRRVQCEHLSRFNAIDEA